MLYKYVITIEHVAVWFVVVDGDHKNNLIKFSKDSFEVIIIGLTPTNQFTRHCNGKSQSAKVYRTAVGIRFVLILLSLPQSLLKLRHAQNTYVGSLQLCRKTPSAS